MKKVNRLRKKIEQNGRYFIPSLVLLAALGAGVYGISSADAQGINQSSIVERLASTFNLDKNEVQKVFDQNRSDREAKAQANFEKTLNQAVTTGVLTEAQKTLIIEKKAEMRTQAESMRANMEDMRNMTPDERKAEKAKKQSEMKARRDALVAWAKDNGIDIKYMMGFMGRRGDLGISDKDGMMNMN